jgi:hypothetical protein
MYVDDVRRYVYCLVSKASCTTWKRVLLTLTGRVPSDWLDAKGNIPVAYVHNHDYTDSIIKRLINFPPSEVSRRLLAYYKFAVVRDPLDRLVSAYRDKILTDPYYTVGRDIVRRYRPSYSSSDNHSQNTSQGAKATFPEFVQYILDEWSAGHVLDRHWRPQSDLCSPCLVQYDFVGHQETLASDAAHILSVLRRRATPPLSYDSPPVGQAARFARLDDSKFPDSEVIGPEDFEYRPRSPTSRQFIRRMLSQLSNDTLRRVVQIYHDDYELFDYQRPDL